MTFVVRANKSIFAVHPGIRTMFMTFRHHTHAVVVKKSLHHFVLANKTLPLTYPEADKPIELTYPGDWMNIAKNLNVDEITSKEVLGLCEIHSAGRMHVIDMKEPTYRDGYLQLTFDGTIYEGGDMNTEDMKRYLDMLIA